MTPIAVALCKENEMSFEDVFRYQYTISSSELDLAGFTTHTLGPVVLQTGEALGCLELHDARGRLFGLIFGVSAPHDGQPVDTFLRDRFDSQANDAASVFESRLTHLSGRFGVIVTLGDDHRFYTDASGMIGANYCAESKIAATSVNLCIPRPADADGLAAAKPGVFALDYTSDHAVSRLNPNHYLDLDTFETKRFWPREDDIFHLDPPQYAAALDEIILATRQIINRMAAENSVAVPLSGGFDSRSIVALADDVTLHGISQIHTHVTTKINITDAAVANQICGMKSIGLEVHNTLRTRRFPGIDSPKYIESRCKIANGGMGQPHNFLLNGTYTRVKRDSVVLRGQQIPILRGLFVNNADSAHWTADTIAAHFMNLLQLNDLEDEALRADFKMRVSAIYDELPTNARQRALDLLLVEAVNGPDLTSWMCAVSQSFYTSPYNSRRMIQLFSSFDTKFRRAGHAMNLLLLRADPSLMGVAFLGAAKKVSSAENDQLIEARRKWLEGIRSTYRWVFGHDAEAVRMIRFRTDGIVR
ncbi:hypothetical protein QTO30_04545 [Yoonia sp. GPGPB17]|uniref:hypothetical protein n=1 Tax=Yoonia sp. GPGPB17 TaxID=3026147 RepID=UPI0030BC390F